MNAFKKILIILICLAVCAGAFYAGMVFRDDIMTFFSTSASQNTPTDSGTDTSTPSGSDTETPSSSDTETPTDSVVTTNFSDFIFGEVGVITGYTGTDTTVVVPATYSLELGTLTYAIQDGETADGEPYDMVITNALGDGKTVKVSFADGSTQEFNSSEQYMEYFMENHTLFIESLVSVEFEGYVAVEGNDIVITILLDTFMDNTTIEYVDLSQTSITALSRTFYGCTSLKTIIFPTTLKTISAYAFYGCTFDVLDLSGTNLTTIDHAFNNLTVNSIILPDTLTSVTEGFSQIIIEYIDLSNTQITSLWSTFYKSSTLKEVILPATVNSIVNYTFADCSSLEKIILPTNEVVEIDFAHAFNNCTATIYVPSNLLESYKTTYSDYSYMFDAIA